ncbi:MAG: DUF362 domain-containing protein [Sumerlaeia bacterium]
MRICHSASSAPNFDFAPDLGKATLIVLKPNLGYAKQHPVVTRAQLLHDVINHLLTIAPQAKLVMIEGICCKQDFFTVMKRVGVAEWFDWQRFNATGIATGATLQWGERVELWDADCCPTRAYTNTAKAFRFSEILAPAILAEADAGISVAPLKKTYLKNAPLISGAVKNLFGLLPRSAYKARSANSRGQLHRPDVHQVVCDVHGCLAPYFQYGIIDLHEFFESNDWKPDSGKATPMGKTVFASSLLHADLEAMSLLSEPLDHFHTLLLERFAKGANQ